MKAYTYIKCYQCNTELVFDMGSNDKPNTATLTACYNAGVAHASHAGYTIVVKLDTDQDIANIMNDGVVTKVLLDKLLKSAVVDIVGEPAMPTPASDSCD